MYVLHKSELTAACQLWLEGHNWYNSKKRFPTTAKEIMHWYVAEKNNSDMTALKKGQLFFYI
jgi:hypothetical protein